VEITVVEGLRAVRFDLVLTLALAALFLFVGGFVRRRAPLAGGFFIDLSNSLVITTFFNLVIKYLK
jgi:Na+/glutamate symporter